MADTTLSTLIGNLNTQKTRSVGENTTTSQAFAGYLRGLADILGVEPEENPITTDKILFTSKPLEETVAETIETRTIQENWPGQESSAASLPIAFSDLLNILLNSSNGAIKTLELDSNIIKASATKATEVTGASYTTPISVTEMETLINNVYKAGEGKGTGDINLYSKAVTITSEDSEVVVEPKSDDSGYIEGKENGFNQVTITNNSKTEIATNVYNKTGYGEGTEYQVTVESTNSEEEKTTTEAQEESTTTTTTKTETVKDAVTSVECAIYMLSIL